MTMCADTPEAIRAGMKKHGCQAIMLADPETKVIEELGIRNQGVHSGMPGGPRLPIPTTVLVDAAGVVRWIDQSENYQQRSDPDTVLAALQAHLA